MSLKPKENSILSMILAIALADEEKTMKKNQEILDELPFRYAVEFYKCESGVYAKRWIRLVFISLT